MARRVFFHVGTLKTGTTFLQRVMWHNRSALRRAGLLVPGDHYQDRVWATQTIREMAQPHETAASAWTRIVRQVRDFDGDAVISHEFFGGASRAQIERALADLGPTELHVVCTARDLVQVFPAFWQEQVKFRYRGRFEDYEPRSLDAASREHWSWRTIDVSDVLRRWAAGLPPDRVHVITTPPPGHPREELWDRFAGVCGVDPSVARLDKLPPANVSLGLVETEMLRRVNEGLAPEMKAPGVAARWLRRYLGEGLLGSREGEKVRLDQARAKEMRERSLRIVDEIRAAGYDVVGDLDDLVGPETVPTARAPEDVSDAELLDASLYVINRMIVDLRKVSEERDRLRRRLRPSRARLGTRVAPVVSRRVRAVRRRLRRPRAGR